MVFSERKPSFERWWPNLKKRGYKVIGQASDSYNCFSYAVGLTDVLLDPAFYWPDNIARGYTLEIFIKCFENYGYVCCENSDLETGVEKAVIYGRGDLPLHAARQMDNGLWTSKIGSLELIEHHLDAFDIATQEFANYGSVLQFLSRQKRQV